MRDLVSDITAIDVSKYAHEYSSRLPYAKYDLNLIRSIEDHVLSWLVDVCDELDPITVYDNYVEVLDRMENMLGNDNE